MLMNLSYSKTIKTTVFIMILALFAKSAFGQFQNSINQKQNSQNSDDILATQELINLGRLTEAEKIIRSKLQKTPRNAQWRFLNAVLLAENAISKKNKVNFQEGMIVSNEPGYYEKNKFGIRIENLIYVKENNKKMNFENLTMVPIEKDLIIQENLNYNEKRWLNNYHKIVFKNLIKSMNKIEAQDLKKACSAI